jgi:hypothetical protein
VVARRGSAYGSTRSSGWRAWDHTSPVGTSATCTSPTVTAHREDASGTERCRNQHHPVCPVLNSPKRMLSHTSASTYHSVVGSIWPACVHGSPVAGPGRRAARAS